MCCWVDTLEVCFLVGLVSCLLDLLIDLFSGDWMIGCWVDLLIG